MTSVLSTVHTSFESMQRIFDVLHNNQYIVGNTTAKERKQKLQKLQDAILNHRDDIRKAAQADLGKHPSETDMTEIFPIISEIKHAKRELSYWLQKHYVSTPLPLIGSSSYFKYEPKGVVLILSPWNFPFNLTFGPLVAAIAAGNTVILKPSEISSHSSEVMAKIIEEVFDPSEVALVQGGVEIAQFLLTLPFNHIFFTGAPNIGKVVMEAASKHLTSVTLELGGKSPAIVDETANIALAAKRICSAKFINSGQMCIAPDYVLVHESKKDEFLNACKHSIEQFYTNQPNLSTSYGRMSSQKHFERVKNYLENAVLKGAEVVYGGKYDAETRYISPTILTNVNEEAQIMQDEIFGPLMPVFFYKDIQTTINSINSKPKPLGLYIFSNNSNTVETILNQTRAGGSCINHCAIHFYNTNLPFGGSNNSGIGKGHGFSGFKEFSNPRSILHQKLPSVLDLLLPPYNDFKQKLINLAIRYF